MGINLHMYKDTLALFLITVCFVCFFIAVPTATIWGQEAVEKPGFKSLADLQAVYRLLDQETFNANSKKHCRTI